MRGGGPLGHPWFIVAGAPDSVVTPPSVNSPVIRPGWPLWESRRYVVRARFQLCCGCWETVAAMGVRTCCRRALWSEVAQAQPVPRHGPA